MKHEVQESIALTDRWADILAYWNTKYINEVPSTAYNDESTAYVKSAAYNAESTAYNGRSITYFKTTVYNTERTAYNAESTTYIMIEPLPLMFEAPRIMVEALRTMIKPPHIMFEAPRTMIKPENSNAWSIFSIKSGIDRVGVLSCCQHYLWVRCARYCGGSLLCRLFCGFWNRFCDHKTTHDSQCLSLAAESS